MTIRVTREVKGGWDIVRYEGPMNEEAGLHLLPLYESLGPQCLFNLSALTSVNSKGIALWMNFMRDIRESRLIALEECTDCFVMQLNMIPSLTLRIAVRSVLPTFICEACGHAVTRLVAIVGRQPQLGVGNKTSCDKCRGVMRLEDDAEDYFRFLTTSGS